MPTPSTTQAAEADTTRYGMCLLHADFHPMAGDCWTACLDWDLEHQHLPEGPRRNLYQAEVERAMLDTFIRTTRPALSVAP